MASCGNDMSVYSGCHNLHNGSHDLFEGCFPHSQKVPNIDNLATKVPKHDMWSPVRSKYFMVYGYVDPLGVNKNFHLSVFTRELVKVLCRCLPTESTSGSSRNRFSDFTSNSLS